MHPSKEDLIALFSEFRKDFVVKFFFFFYSTDHIVLYWLFAWLSPLIFVCPTNTCEASLTGVEDT